VLHARVQRLNKINQQLATGEKLTLTAYDEIHAGEKRAPEEIYDAIMSATYLLVTEHDNTPHQLLALQRLADFPARAELREQSAYIRSERLEIARSKENRAQEMHTHKIQLDLRKQTHKEKTAQFRQELALAKLRLRSNFNNGWGEDTAEPTSISRDATPADLNAPPSLENPVDPVHPVETPSPSLPSRPSVKSFLSPEVIANNRLYDQKIDAGEIRVIYAPGKHYEIEYCNPADQPALERMHKSAPLRFFEDPTRTQWLPALRTFGPNPYIPPTTPSLNSGGTISGSPTSTSRDAITPTTASPVDPHPD
jgi:hypothetical protein